MKLNKLILFLDFLEKAVVIIGYVYGLYYLLDMAAPLASKAFVIVLITLIFIVYVRQILKKSKSTGELASNNLKLESRPVLSYSALKSVAIISFVSFVILAVTIIYEVFVVQSSRYFPLKLLAGLLIYSIFKQILNRLVNLSSK